MRLLPVLTALVMSVTALQAQVTARDSAIATKLNTEANRQSGPRKSVINALADTLRGKGIIVTPPPVIPAPVATFTVQCDTTGTFKCHFDGSASTGRKITFNWDCGAFPNCTNTTAVFDFVYPHEGQRTAILTVRDSLQRVAQATKTFPVVKPIGPPDTVVQQDSTPPPPPDSGQFVPPELPRATADATPKTCTINKDVQIPMDLQNAINTATPNTCLNLAPGQEWKGNFTLPESCPAGTGWITIQTKGITDKPGVRVTRAEALTFAKITQAFNQFALASSQLSCRWNLLHLNIQSDPTYTGLIYHLLMLGDGGWSGAGEKNIRTDLQPKDFIVRRSWIHGQVNTNLVRCVVTNGIRQAVVDNIIEDCHANGFDSQAVEGWNGWGPFLIENNFLSGASETVMYGGGDPAIDQLRPGDITVRRNHFYKDPKWIGGPWSVKNGFELKNAVRVLVEANVFSPCTWIHAQVGMCLVVKSSGDASARTHLWQGSTDVTFRYNKADQMHRGFNLQAVDGSGQDEVNTHVARIRFTQNLLTNIGNSLTLTNGSDGWLMLFSHDLKNVMVDSNTFVGNRPDAGLTLYGAYSGSAMQNMRFMNNIFAGQSYYHIGADGGDGCCQKAIQYLSPNSWTFAGNVISEVEPEFQNPAGNTYLTSISQFGFTATWKSTAFPTKGANVDLINQKTAGVVTDMAALGARNAPRPRVFKVTAKELEYMAHQPKGGTQ